jgi:hypothetical protein
MSAKDSAYLKNLADEAFNLDLNNNEIAALTRAAAIARALEQGTWQLVPTKPTDEMCASAVSRIKEVTIVIEAGPAKGSTLIPERYYHSYIAMLAAAPTFTEDRGDRVGGDGHEA